MVVIAKTSYTPPKQTTYAVNQDNNEHKLATTPSKIDTTAFEHPLFLQFNNHNNKD